MRITPTEVSLYDPDDYEKIYYIGTKYYKSPEHYQPFGAPTGMFTAVENSIHARRRAPMNPFFSKKAVLRVENVVHEKVKTLCDKLAMELKIHQVAPLHHMFNALSIDVASDYVFNRSFDFLHTPNFARDFTGMIRDVLRAFWVMVLSPVIRSVVMGAPNFITNIHPSIRGYHELFDDTHKLVLRVMNEVDNGKTPAQRLSIFHTLLDPPETDEYKKPRNYKKPTSTQLTDDGVSILVAAAFTTGNAMTLTAYHVINNKSIYSQLRAELLQNFPEKPDKLDSLSLEKLPYLTGCIKEGLRLSYGVIGRLPRVVPAGGAVLDGYTIPAGYKVGMSSWMMHRHPRIWPNHEKFDPTRWVDPAEAKRLNKYMVAFGKDSRQCIGMNLAMCELYVCIANLILRFPDLQVYGMSDKDLVYDDHFSGYQQKQCHELQVMQGSKI